MASIQQIFKGQLKCKNVIFINCIQLKIMSRVWETLLHRFYVPFLSEFCWIGSINHKALYYTFPIKFAIYPFEISSQHNNCKNFNARLCQRKKNLLNTFCGMIDWLHDNRQKRFMKTFPRKIRLKGFTF